ncbi:MAG: hypothetical protein HRU25_02510 [Psychrobium sp.]|nr:hypothetical protein [Psychrobium sp.]
MSHVSLNSDGTLAFTIDTVKERTFWTTASGERLSSLHSNIRFVQFNTSVFSDDNQWFITGSPKQKLKLWQVSDGMLIGEWHAPSLAIAIVVIAITLGSVDLLRLNFIQLGVF